MNLSLNAELHALLTNTGLAPQKKNLCFGFTKGRSDSSRELTDGEAREFINYLRQQPNAKGKWQKDEAADKMRKKIISMAHECGWHNLADNKWVIDMRHLDMWCQQYSYLKKEFNKYTVAELPVLVSQFERVYKSFLKKV